MTVTEPPETHRGRRIVRMLALLAVTAVVLLLAFIGLLTLVRDAPATAVHAFRDPEGPPAAADPEFARTIGLLTGAELRPGHQVDLLLNGTGTYPVLWRDMRAARVSLTVQLYFLLPGRMTDTLVAVLSERARARVPTYLLLDAFGAELPDSALTSLEQAGVHVAVLRPVRWWTLHKAQNRSHVRSVVVDGVIGFTGGFGIDDRWAGDGRHREQWRDTNVRMTGPAVRQLQAAFGRAWSEATGQLLVGELFYPATSPAPESQGTSGIAAAQAALMHSVPTFGPTASARLFALSVASARRSVYISNAYFVPDAFMVRHLQAAAKRGVDVRLLLPSEDTDVPMTRYAAHSWYETLFRSGIQVYEYQPAMLHAKTFVVDGVFSSVGSMNLDYRSFALNDEANVMVVDRQVGARMDSIFMEDLRYARLVDPAMFGRRGRWARLRERFARSIGKAL
jgi:cardiolipin synthase A/B